MIVACLNSLTKKCELAQLDSSQFKSCRLKKFSGHIFIPEVIEPQNLSCASHFDTGMSVFYGDRECVSRFVDLNDELMAFSNFGNTLPSWNKMKLALYIGSMGELFTFAPQALHNFFVKEDGQLIGVADIGKLTKVVPSQYLLDAEYKVVRLTDYMEKCPSEQYQVNLGQRTLQPYAGKSCITGQFDYYLVFPTFNGEFNPLYTYIMTGVQVYKYFDNRTFSEELKPYRGSDAFITKTMQEVTSRKFIMNLLDDYAITYKQLDRVFSANLANINKGIRAQSTSKGEKRYGNNGRLYIKVKVNDVGQRIFGCDSLVAEVHDDWISVDTSTGKECFSGYCSTREHDIVYFKR